MIHYTSDCAILGKGHCASVDRIGLSSLTHYFICRIYVLAPPKIEMKTEEDEDEKRVEERVGSNPGAIPLHGSVGFRFGDPNPNPGSLVASSTGT